MQATLNTNAFQQAWQKRSPKSSPFLHKFTQEMYQNPRYIGQKILHNIPLSIETVMKLESLVAAGADVTVTATKFLKPQTQPIAEKIIEEVGLKYLPEHQINEEFDFYLDCCGELAHQPPPKKGIIELTRTGTNIYKEMNLSVPVISVDDSSVKGLEIFYGTGDGFVRGFQILTKQDVQEHRFLLFGFGQVGQGVANALQKLGSSVVVVDTDKSALSIALGQGFKAIHVEDLNTLKKAINESTTVITATGVKGFLTTQFKNTPELVQGKILANIGAEDEIGSLFGHVLANGLPINFALEEPTLMRYLDPIMYAHNLGVGLILDRTFTPGYHPFPAEVSRKILNNWEEIHKEPIGLLI